MSEGINLSLPHSSEFVPQWAKKVIWYQILPERFRNGDPTNDPTVNDIEGADPPETPVRWNIHPWGSDWYELQEYERQNGDPEIWNHLLRRRYGGDLRGIMERLDYLQDLGITGLYLNPVFDSPSLHKYDGASFHHIDPTFGPDPKGDRKLIENEDPLNFDSWVWTSADEYALELIDEVHRRGMHIIFDGVFNHMGINSFAFRDVVKHQSNSRFKNWFEIYSWDDPDKGTAFDYRGWWNVKSLPELRQDENGIVAGPREYIFAASERWLNPKGKGVAHGIDGWRLDVAYCIRHEFWRDWRKHVKCINPNAYITAELFKPPEVVEPYLRGNEFDGEMNYNFAFTCAEYFFDPDGKRISTSAFDAELKYLRELYPPGVAYVSQNLFNSHDSNRIASHIVNRGIGDYRNWKVYHNLSKPVINPHYSPRKPKVEDVALQKLFVIFQMTYVGAPMIYYGDEGGMWGGDDPCCRKPMVWDDIRYAPEVYNPDGSKHDPDTVEVNHELLAHYKKLISIRKKYKALQVGDFEKLAADDRKNLYAFRRSYENETVLVILNNSDREVEYILPEITGSECTDLLAEGRTYREGDILRIKSRWGAVLVERQN
jgi:cyclomaltodextrinase / maltogenic alpha-amylase / neopullulanase